MTLAGLPSRRLPSAQVAQTSSCFPLIPNLATRSEEHTSELQSLMRISYAVFCLKKKNYQQTTLNSMLSMQVFNTSHIVIFLMYRHSPCIINDMKSTKIAVLKTQTNYSLRQLN